MTINDWLTTRSKLLLSRGIESARLDCVLMLEKALRTDRAQLYTRLDEDVPKLEASVLEVLFAKRYRHEPMAYILGSAEFYGRRFVVNEHVLVPRPESEAIIELAQQQSSVEAVIDIGTGSGALAITLALEHITDDVIGIDIDPQCLAVARENAKQLGANVTFIQSDLLHELNIAGTEQRTGFVANLPYVPDDYPINDAARHEPALALFSGADGLEHYRKLFVQLPSVAAWIITEALESQHSQLKKIAEQAGYSLLGHDGLAQVFGPTDGFRA